MDNREVHKIVKREMTAFLKENGFKQYRSNAWIIYDREVICRISPKFLCGQEKFTFNIAFQPWCIPSDDIYMNYSNELDVFVPDSKKIWGSYDEEQLMSDIEELKKIFSEKILPMINGIKTCKDFIYFIGHGGEKLLYMGNHKKSRLLAYMMFYTHDLFSASKYAGIYFDLNAEPANSKIEADKACLNELLSLTVKRDINGIDSFFSEIKEKNKINFKLK